ncbi:hypothetical protein ACP70R_004957 [Stipagrostis hirtigluma subsp. patula]
MAAKRLLVPAATVCYLLVVLAAQGTEAAIATTTTNVQIIVSGRARCSNNPSMLIKGAPVNLTINGNTTVVATGETSSSMGRLFIAFNVTSSQQLLSLVHNEAVVTAPPQACGAPPNAAAKLAAPISSNGYGVVGPTSKAQVLAYLSSVSPVGPQVLGSEVAGDAGRAQAAIAASDGFFHLSNGQRPLLLYLVGLFSYSGGN